MCSQIQILKVKCDFHFSTYCITNLHQMVKSWEASAQLSTVCRPPPSPREIWGAGIPCLWSPGELAWSHTSAPGRYPSPWRPVEWGLCVCPHQLHPGKYILWDWQSTAGWICMILSLWLISGHLERLLGVCNVQCISSPIHPLLCLHSPLRWAQGPGPQPQFSILNFRLRVSERQGSTLFEWDHGNQVERRAISSLFWTIILFRLAVTGSLPSCRTILGPEGTTVKGRKLLFSVKITRRGE